MVLCREADGREVVVLVWSDLSGPGSGAVVAREGRGSAAVPSPGWVPYAAVKSSESMPDRSAARL